MRWRRAVDVMRTLVIGVLVGVLGGSGSFVFLRCLDWATRTRLAHGWLLWLLPAAGLSIGLIHLGIGGVAVRGTNLVLDELHEPTIGPPRRMAPLVLLGTTLTHLFGGSGGREGAAVQIAASLTSWFRRGVRPSERPTVLVAAIAAGFGSVFGVPFAGAVFALEVPVVRRLRWRSLLPAVVASFTGDRVTRGLGIRHATHAGLDLDVGLRGALGLLVAAVGVGLVAAAFVELTHLIRRQLSARIRFPALRPVLGGLAVLALTVAVGTRAYLGLSLPLLDAALLGSTVAAAAFAWKLVFTSVTIGAGFPGGEVTPLFCIGACFGSVLAGPLGLPRATLAALAMAATFSAASNTPLACTVLGMELFGLRTGWAFLLVCALATIVSGDRSVYGQQRVHRRSGPTTVAAGGHPRWASRRARAG